MTDFRHIRAILASLRGGEASPPRQCPEPRRLADYVEGRLGAEEREQFEKHLADCSSCFAAFTLSAFPVSQPTIDQETEAVNRALRFWDSLGRGWLELGIASLGIKVIRSQAVEPALERGRLRLRALLPRLPALSQVYPLGKRRFRVTAGSWESVLEMDTGAEGVSAALVTRVPEALTQGGEVDLLEDGELLLSDSLREGRPVSLPEMRLGRRYTLVLRHDRETEVSLQLRPVIFGLNDILSLCIYHVANGDTHAAMNVLRQNIPGPAGLRERLERVARLLRNFMDLIPEVRALSPEPQYRFERPTEQKSIDDVEAVLYRLVRSEPAVSVLGETVPQEVNSVDWETVERKLAAALCADPENDRLRVVHHAVEAWRITGVKAPSENVILVAAAKTLSSYAEGVDSPVRRSPDKEDKDDK